MLKSPLIICLFIQICFKSGAQDIRIYHAAKGQSALFIEGDNERNSRWTDRVFIRPKGSKIEIVVLNPNPFFYNYDLKLEDFEIKDDFPDIADLLGAINNLKELGDPPLLNGMPAPSTPLKIFFEQLDILKEEIDEAKKSIINSDQPESKRVALLMTTADGGFRKAVADINKISDKEGHFNSPTLEKDLEKFLNTALTDSIIIKTKSVEKFKDAFTSLNNQYITIVKEIIKSCKADPVLRFEIPVTDKNQKVYLEITKKEGHKDKIRLEEKKLICTIIPEFDRKTIDLVPVVNLTYSANPPQYGVKNGLITQSNSDGFKFSAGAMLLINWLHFGKYKEMAWGAGLGYAIPKKNVLEGFNIGTMVSYKHTFRIGLGAGFSSYPGGLKNDLQVGMGLPTDIKNIEEVVDYKRKFSFFFTFSLSGITILKK